MPEGISELQKKKKTRFPISRIKKLIQLNEDIGKTVITVPVILSKAIEEFINELISKMVTEAEKINTKKISNDHYLEVINKDPSRFFFLLPVEEDEKI